MTLIRLDHPTRANVIHRLGFFPSHALVRKLWCHVLGAYGVVLRVFRCQGGSGRVGRNYYPGESALLRETTYVVSIEGQAIVTIAKSKIKLDPGQRLPQRQGRQRGVRGDTRIEARSRAQVVLEFSGPSMRV